MVGAEGGGESAVVPGADLLFEQVVAAEGKKPVAGFGLVVGIGPGQWLPVAVFVYQGEFGMDAVPEVDAVGEGFGCGEDKVVEREQAGVNIDEAPVGPGKLLFDAAGHDFCGGKQYRGKGRRETEPAAGEAGTELGLVVIGEIERDVRASFYERAELRFKPFFGCGKQFGAGGEQPAD